MKNYLLLLTLTIFTLNLNSQEISKKVDYVVTYEFSYVIDTSNCSMSPSFDFLLMHANHESRFYPANKLFNDSMGVVWELANPHLANPKTQEEIQEAVNQFTTNMRTWKKNNPVEFVIRKDFEHNLFQSVVRFSLPPKHLEESLILKWDILPAQDTILGVRCHQAKTKYGGRNYTAYFAPSIPIPDGPYIFSGLPGLILKITDDQGWFLFLAKQITVKAQDRFWHTNYINPVSQKIDRTAYVEAMSNMKNNPKLRFDAKPEKILEIKNRRKNKFYYLLEKNK